ncbi:hypothetical protein [Jiangella asiatica]|uniref:hypothetical protein n=1 Tax=Jiangella asiatica TaxID=2530372 RepID=UPI001EF0FD28|nr:hypothetical protein [Jiangella asiatica]
MVLTIGALVAGTSGAGVSAADDLPTPATPAAPELVSAVVTGCQAPCALGETGEVAVTYNAPPATEPDVSIGTIIYFDGVRINGFRHTLGGNPRTRWFLICASRTEPSSDCINPITRVDALRGAETITARSYAITGNPDDGTQRISELSEPSNAIVATQG